MNKPPGSGGWQRGLRYVSASAGPMEYALDIMLFQKFGCPPHAPSSAAAVYWHGSAIRCLPKLRFVVHRMHASNLVAFRSRVEHGRQGYLARLGL